MNNKAKFYEWLKREKKYSPIEFRFKRMDYESLSRRYNFFEISDPDKLKSLDNDKDKEMIELYRGFLETLVDKKVDSVDTTSDKRPVVENDSAAKELATQENSVPMPEEDEDSATDVHINKEYGFIDFSNESEKAENALSNKCSLKKKDHITPKNKQLLSFDIVTGQFYDPNNNVIAEPMATYAIYDIGEGNQKKYLRKKNAFYYDDSYMPNQTSVVGAYYNDGDVIKRALDDTYDFIFDGFPEIDEKLLCIVPDTAGDFNDKIKSQVKSANHRFVQLPRSIAAVYSCIDISRVKSEKEYTVYDFDADKLTKTIIRVEFDEESEKYNFVRYGRRTFSVDSFDGFPSIAKLYIDMLSKQNKIVLEESIINNLINTRDIYKVICKKQNILVKNKGQYYTIKYDERIMGAVVEQIISCVNNDGGNNPIIMFATHLKEKSFVSVDDVAIGCQRVLKRIENKQVIYKEYLPELSLEVIRNGTFDVLELISKKNPPQVITEASMDEEVNIPIENGRFVFMSGRDKLYCPLTREEFGESKKGDKLAMFYDPKIFPLKAPVEVELSLKYRYGDPDSYRLIATPLNNEFEEITSQWCDDEDRIMGNDVIPEYSQPIIKSRATEDDFNDAVSQTYKSLRRSHNYTLQGGYNGNPPFDNYNNWLALKSLGKIRLSLPLLFSPEKINAASEEVLDNFELLLEDLLDVYDDCISGNLDSGNLHYPCDFTKEYYSLIRTNILDKLALFGGFCSSDCDYSSVNLERMVEVMLNSHSLYNLLPLTTYVTRDKDYYGIWDKVDQLINYTVKNNKNLSSIVRGLSAIAWRNSQWIYEFGQINDNVLDEVITTIFDEFYSLFRDLKDNGKFKGDNPRAMRDILEALLAIVRLKPCNSTVMKKLDCNRKMIKHFVNDLKELDMIAKNVLLKHPFVSRIDVDVPENLRNVSSVVYPLIETLSDGNAVKLTGFTED